MSPEVLNQRVKVIKYEIQGPQKDLQSKQDSRNSWDEVNLNSIHGVCVDERVATSTSSFRGMTEPGISHPPRAGSDPKLFLQRANRMPKAASKLAAAPSTPPARISKSPVTVRSSFIPTTSLPIEGTEATRNSY